MPDWENEPIYVVRKVLYLVVTNLSKMIYFILDKEAKFNKGTQSRILIEEQFKSLADKITKEVIK